MERRQSKSKLKSEDVISDAEWRAYLADLEHELDILNGLSTASFEASFYSKAAHAEREKVANATSKKRNHVDVSAPH